jgi:hypothetical protein
VLSLIPAPNFKFAKYCLVVPELYKVAKTEGPYFWIYFLRPLQDSRVDRVDMSLCLYLNDMRRNYGFRFKYQVSLLDTG